LYFCVKFSHQAKCNQAEKEFTYHPTIFSVAICIFFFLTECEFKVGSEKRCVPKNEIDVNLKCVEYVCKITKKKYKEYKAQMKRKRRDKAAIGLYIHLVSLSTVHV